MNNPNDPRESCPECKGTGYRDDARTVPDPVCQGTGLLSPDRLADYERQHAQGSPGQGQPVSY